MITAAQTASARNTQQKLEQARQILEAGAIDRSIGVLREILREEPENADAHLLLGSALALVPERSESLQELRKAIELRPSFAPGYYALGTALARFAQLDARFADAHVSLALLLAQRNERTSASAHLTQAIEIYGKSPAAAYPHHLLAKILVEESKLDQALQALEVAIRLRPNYGEAYLSQGLIRKQLLQQREALQAFQKAVQFAPENPTAQYELGTAYLHSGDASQALVHLRKAAELKPGDRYVLFQLCRALHKAGKSEEAKECQEKLAARVQAEVTSDLSATRLNNEGVELENAGDLAGAFEKYRAAVEVNAFQTVFKRNLGLVLCRLGRWEEGIVELRKVLELDPEDTEATQALYIALEKTKKK